MSAATSSADPIAHDELQRAMHLIMIKPRRDVEVKSPPSQRTLYFLDHSRRAAEAQKAELKMRERAKAILKWKCQMNPSMLTELKRINALGLEPGQEGGNHWTEETSDQERLMSRRLSLASLC